MHQYRVTKYNPVYRNENGVYLNDDWTDFSCIGKMFGGVLLDYQEYFKVEAAYIEALESFLTESMVMTVKIVDIENHHDLQLAFKENEELHVKNLKFFISDILRGYYWCKFESDNAFIHFGHDYYMYIGCPIEPIIAIQNIEKKGLFAEKFLSPYQPA